MPSFVDVTSVNVPDGQTVFLFSYLQPDKLGKALNYMDAAMYFVESGIAMEKDPQISMSSFTMFAETLDLLKYEASSLVGFLHH